MSEPILDAIANPKMHQAEIALLYAARIAAQWKRGQRSAWNTINAAIIGRWSVSGLLRIKREAWRHLEAKP